MSRPRHLLRAWPRLARKLRRAPRRALFTDYDGTLTRIRRRPDQARLAPRMRRALQQAAATGDVAGVVSGRRIDDVRRLAGVEGIWYAGAHGSFVSSPRGRQVALLSPIARRRVAAVARVLRRKLRGLPGIVVEPKQGTVAIHYRRATRRRRELAWKVVQPFLDGRMQLVAGKKVWDLAPLDAGKQVDKWSAVRFILQEEGIAARQFANVVYLGDDTTDERVFRALPGITVAVGKRRRTAARFYLDSPREVLRFLRRWARLQK
jgi:trehalose-phosphatase